MQNRDSNFHCKIALLLLNIISVKEKQMHIITVGPDHNILESSISFISNMYAQ